MTAQTISDAADGTGWSPPRGLEQRVPRRVRLRIGVRHGLMGLLGGVLTFAAIIGLVAALAVHRRSLLLAHGMLGQGVVRALNESHGRGGGYRVEYGFTVPTPPNPAEAVQVGRDMVTEPQFRRLTIGSPVSILYLPQRPDISTLYFTPAFERQVQSVRLVDVLVDVPAALAPVLTGALLFAIPYHR